MNLHCGLNQSHTHFTSTKKKCQSTPTAMLKAPVCCSSRSCFCQAYQRVGIITTLPTRLSVVSICPEGASAVLLWCMPAVWCCHTTALSDCRSPLGTLVAITTTRDYSFWFVCQQAKRMIRYNQICIIGIFHSKGCFLYAKVKATPYSFSTVLWTNKHLFCKDTSQKQHLYFSFMIMWFS